MPQYITCICKDNIHLFGVIMSNEKLAKLLNEANVLLDAIELTIENMFSAARDVHRSNDSL